MFLRKKSYVIKESISIEDQEKIETVLSWIPSVIKVKVNCEKRLLQVYSKQKIEKCIFINEMYGLGFSIIEKNVKSIKK